MKCDTARFFFLLLFHFFITAKVIHEKSWRNMVLIKLKHSRNMTKYYVKELLCLFARDHQTLKKGFNDMLSQKFTNPTINNCDI